MKGSRVLRPLRYRRALSDTALFRGGQKEGGKNLWVGSGEGMKVPINCRNGPNAPLDHCTPCKLRHDTHESSIATGATIEGQRAVGNFDS